MDRHFNPIIFHDNDVLSGRGINISNHPGNERFRALVKIFRDDAYSISYSLAEKKVVAKEVIEHIHALDPPGRFLKLERSSSHGEEWRNLSESEAMQKTCQALRDCNRQDRSGYASTLVSPTDVVNKARKISNAGLTIKQRAAAAVSKEIEKKRQMTSLDHRRAHYTMMMKGMTMNRQLTYCAHHNHFYSNPPPITSSLELVRGINSQQHQNYHPNSTSIVHFSLARPIYPQATIPGANHFFQEVQRHAPSPMNTPYNINNRIDYPLPYDHFEYN